MECLQVLFADNVVEGVDGLLEGLRCPHIMSGCKGVAGVDADAHTVLILNQLDDVPQILPSCANDITAACHILQHGNHRLGCLVGLVQLRGNASDSSGPRVTVRRARVEVVQADAELFAAIQVVDEAGVGLVGLGLVSLGKVDEIGAVGKGMFSGAVAMVLALADELRLGGRIEGRVGPFALRFEEEGE